MHTWSSPPTVEQEQDSQGVDAVEAGPSTAAWPSAPSYNFEVPPRCATVVDCGALQSEASNNFFRSARWTADATAVLTTAEDRVLRVFDTPGTRPEMVAPRELAQPDAVNAAVWYPSASALAPETFCFVSSVRDTPVRLVDATDGRIRATYPIVDHRERFIAPHCLAFTPDATKLYCGFDSAIEVLDIASPGPNNSERLKTSYTRREKGGQKGIISAIAFSPHSIGSYAAGSFSGSIVLYDEDTGTRAAGHLEAIEGGGVTQLAYHPLDPNTIFAASRRSEAIQVYDLRDTSVPVGRLERPGSTNQRIWFDVDPWGRWLASGDENGQVRVWDIANAEYRVVMEQDLHKDSINSVKFHPFKPLLLTSSGSRAYLRLSEGSDSSGSEEDSDDEMASDSRTAGPADSTMAIWSFESI